MARRSRTSPTLIQRSRRVSPAQKAIYHQVFGAGRARVRREFFDLNEADEDAVVAFLEARLGRRLDIEVDRG